MTLGQIEQLAEALETVSAELWPAEPRERAKVPFSDREAVAYPQGRISHAFSDRPISGQSSPWGLDLELHREGDEIEARLTLRAGHEGAPNRSHGGIVAALFDDVFGYVLGVAQQPAFTGDLYVRYVAPTPIHEDLACRVRLTERNGRKMLMTGELTHGASGQLLASARATFIAVDASAFERQTAERPPPPISD